MLKRYVDCHTHLFPPDRMRKLVRWSRRFRPLGGPPEDLAVEDVVAELRRAGARRWANLLFPLGRGEAPGLHRFNADLAARHPEIVPFGGVLPTDRDPLGTVQEAIERWGMAGLKFHPMVQRFSPAHPALDPVFDYLDGLGKAVYIHTGYDEWYGWHLRYGDLEHLVGRYGRLAFVFAHLAFPHLDWAFDLAERHPSVWLDVTGVFTSILMMEDDPDGPEAGEAARLRSVLAERLPSLSARVMFGTDHPIAARSLEEIFTELATFDVDPGLLGQITFETASRFLDRYGSRDPPPKADPRTI